MIEFLQNVCLAHLGLLMNTSAKYQANWTETVGGVVQTRFCGQTDHPTDRQADSSIPLTNFVCGGIITVKNDNLRKDLKFLIILWTRNNFHRSFFLYVMYTPATDMKRLAFLQLTTARLCSSIGEVEVGAWIPVCCTIFFCMIFPSHL